MDNPSHVWCCSSQHCSKWPPFRAFRLDYRRFQIELSVGWKNHDICKSMDNPSHGWCCSSQHCSKWPPFRAFRLDYRRFQIELSVGWKNHDICKSMDNPSHGWCCSSQHCSKWPPFRTFRLDYQRFQIELSVGTWCTITQIIPRTFCYTRRCATTIFSTTHRCNAGTMFGFRCQRSIVCSFYRHWCPKDIP